MGHQAFIREIYREYCHEYGADIDSRQFAALVNQVRINRKPFSKLSSKEVKRLSSEHVLPLVAEKRRSLSLGDLEENRERLDRDLSNLQLISLALKLHAEGDQTANAGIILRRMSEQSHELSQEAAEVNALYEIATDVQVDMQPKRAQMQEKMARLPDQVGDYPKKNTSLAAESNANDPLFTGIKKYREGYDVLVKENAEKFNLNPQDIQNGRAFRNALIKLIQERAQTNSFCSKTPKEKAENPESAMTSLEKLLGEDGKKLYVMALQEEVNDKQFRIAAKENSTRRFTGQKKSPLRDAIVLGGPSGAGKSTALEKVILDMYPDLQKDEHGEHEYVVQDGGEVRNSSQMRRVLVQFAVDLGYTGISDLREKSHSLLKPIKEHIFQHGLENKSVNVAVADTFSDCGFTGMTAKKTNMLKSMGDMDNSNFTFVEVVGENKEKFPQVVAFLQSRRALKTRGFENDQQYDLNEDHGIPESKIDSAKGFRFGVKGTRNAIEWFTSECKNPNRKYKTVANDAILVKPKNNDTTGMLWEPAKHKSDPGVVVVSRHCFDAWHESDQQMSLLDYSGANFKKYFKVKNKFDVAFYSDFSRKIDGKIQALKDIPLPAGCDASAERDALIADLKSVKKACDKRIDLISLKKKYKGVKNKHAELMNAAVANHKEQAKISYLSQHGSSQSVQEKINHIQYAKFLNTCLNRVGIKRAQMVNGALSQHEITFADAAKHGFGREEAERQLERAFKEIESLEHMIVWQDLSEEALQEHKESIKEKYQQIRKYDFYNNEIQTHLDNIEYPGLHEISELRKLLVDAESSAELADDMARETTNQFLDRCAQIERQFPGCQKQLAELKVLHAYPELRSLLNDLKNGKMVDKQFDRFLLKNLHIIREKPELRSLMKNINQEIIHQYERGLTKIAFEAQQTLDLHESDFFHSGTHVTSAVRQFEAGRNKIYNTFLTRVKNCQSTKEVTLSLERFTHVMHACLQNHNYLMASAIHDIINQVRPFHPYKEALSQMSESAKIEWNEANYTLSQSNNHAILQETIAQETGQLYAQHDVALVATTTDLLEQTLDRDLSSLEALEAQSKSAERMISARTQYAPIESSMTFDTESDIDSVLPNLKKLENADQIAGAVINNIEYYDADVVANRLIKENSGFKKQFFKSLYNNIDIKALNVNQAQFLLDVTKQVVDGHNKNRKHDNLKPSRILIKGLVTLSQKKRTLKRIARKKGPKDTALPEDIINSGMTSNHEQRRPLQDTAKLTSSKPEKLAMQVWENRDNFSTSELMQTLKRKMRNEDGKEYLEKFVSELTSRFNNQTERFGESEDYDMENVERIANVISNLVRLHTGGERLLNLDEPLNSSVNKVLNELAHMQSQRHKGEPYINIHDRNITASTVAPAQPPEQQNQDDWVQQYVLQDDDYSVMAHDLFEEESEDQLEFLSGESVEEDEFDFQTDKSDTTNTTQKFKKAWGEKYEGIKQAEDEPDDKLTSDVKRSMN